MGGVYGGHLEKREKILASRSHGGRDRRRVTNPDCFRPLCHPKAHFAKKELKSRKDCDKIGRRVFCAPIGIKQHQLTILKSIAG